MPVQKLHGGLHLNSKYLFSACGFGLFDASILTWLPLIPSLQSLLFITYLLRFWRESVTVLQAGLDLMISFSSVGVVGVHHLIWLEFSFPSHYKWDLSGGKCQCTI